MTFLPALLVTTVLQSAPHPKLEAVLSALAADETRRESVSCSLVERTVLDELDGKGAPKGKLTREFSFVQSPKGHQRALKAESVEGDVSRLFRQRPKDESERPHPGPFHPSERAHYEYRLEAEEGAKTGVVHFEPKEPHDKRAKGRATVSLESPKLLTLDAEPSKYPVYLDALRMRVHFEKTACGHMPVRVTAQGHGKFLLMRARFRSETELTGHSPAGEGGR